MPPTLPRWMATLTPDLLRAEQILRPYLTEDPTAQLEDALTDLLVYAEAHRLNIDAAWEQADVRATARLDEANWVDWMPPAR